ncbi:hypothetical protein [Bradyrhizobium sp. LMTR 3]|uniref:hypothetical protein n=1 Tax=Bradyrhizobium sp. LMTR 3 TaxID=189873 RepID=UPI001146B92B|nr:hypothetical protein [Bradyrhizobium sp. LMTR 3]
MLRTFFNRSERVWCFILLLFSSAAHAYSMLVTGAKYWIDSIAYFQLGMALFDVDQLSQLYSSQFGFLYQHFTPGLPLLIRTLESIFQERLWPALAILQGAFSASAITYFILAFKNKLSRPAQLIVVILCGLHPYFASFHNAAMTESVSASILLVSLGVAVRSLDGRLSLRRSLLVLLLLSILAAQFRPYLGVVGGLLAALIVYWRGKPWRLPLYAVTALALAAGILAFPLYRAALGLGFFLPNTSALLLTHTSYVAWDLDQDTAHALDDVVLSAEIRTRLIGDKPINYDDAKRIFDDLIGAGLSPDQAKQKIASAAWRVRTSSMWVMERQLQLPLASIGFQIAPMCCQPNRQLTRELTGSAMFNHIRHYFHWNSGVDGGSYTEVFDRFSEMTRASHIFSDVADNFYVSRIRPYVTDSLKSLRDPLRLTLLVSDPLIIVSWLGLLLCFRRGQRIGLLALAVPFAVIYVAAFYAHIFGDNRHAHPLIPIVVVGFVKVADEFLANGWWRLRGLLRALKNPSANAS